MEQKNCQKIKMLKLIELLRQETDEQNPLTTSDICRRLTELGITCDRRTLYRDIALLNDIGYEVMITQVGREKGYYVDDRSFSVPELKILIDAVQASSFITSKKTAELIDKLAALGGSHRADIIKSNIVYFNTRKHSNEAIYYNVDALEEALQNREKVIFRYFDLDEKGKKIYRRDGHHYVAEPVALVFNEDNYYLISYSSNHGNTANYRLDRMDSVEMIDEPVSQKALEMRSQVAEYTEQAFKMFGGQPVNIEIEFESKLIGAVYDRFGEETVIKHSSNGKLTAWVRVQLSPTFWGWIFQFAGQMKIISPDSVIREYRERAKIIAQQ